MNQGYVKMSDVGKDFLFKKENVQDRLNNTTNNHTSPFLNKIKTVNTTSNVTQKEDMIFKFPLPDTNKISEDYGLIGYIYTTNTADDTVYQLFERQPFSNIYEYIIKTHNGIILQLETRNWPIEDNENIGLLLGQESKGEWKVKRYKKLPNFVLRDFK